MSTVFCLSLCISPHQLNSTGLQLLLTLQTVQGMMRLSTLFLASVAFFLLICCTIYSLWQSFDSASQWVLLLLNWSCYILSIYFLVISASPHPACPLKLCDHLCKSCHPPFSNLPVINIILDQLLLSSMKWILMTTKTQQQ